MNFFNINPAQYRKDFSEVVNELVISLKSGRQEIDQLGMQMIDAMQQSIDVLERIDRDQQQGAKSLSGEDISQIGEYMLNLLDELSIVAANRGMQKTMLSLHRLSLPVAIWLGQHGGIIAKLDIIVNAIASLANELQQPEKLEQMAEIISDIVHVVDKQIARDLEATNPMRPWRILNLNWGIVATRSHNAQLMEQVFEQMLINIPADAKGFFREGMQQMDIIGYPQHVRDVMEKFNQRVGNASSLH